MTVLLDRIGQRPNDVLPRRIVSDVAQIFGQRVPGDRQAFAVQQARVEQSFHQWLDSADGDELGH